MPSTIGVLEACHVEGGRISHEVRHCSSVLSTPRRETV
ncbi:unnamed protein product [Haemonchus placei]|uniref:Uncharacterized protein n=1 Tax=Haemonchus placei TaxID=6290 RepID=A0A3P7WLJ1_HAEPC|nr:unnamed protein product [Haemonchus placei]